MPTRGAVLIVFNQDQQVLLHKREDFRIWTLPGGGIEPGETWQEAAARETLEETGYQVGVESLVGEYWRPQMPGGGSRTYVGMGRVVGGAPLTRGPETLEVRWFAVTDLPKRLSRFARLYLEDALTDTPKPIQRTLRMPIYEALLLRLLFRLRDLRNRWLRRP